MKIKLILFFIFLTINLYSQDALIISFGAELNPKIVTNIFKKSDKVDVYYPLSGSIAGNVYLHLNARLSLQTGLSFSFLKTGQKDYSISFGCDNDGNGGSLPRNSWTNSEYTNYYVGIPLAFQWKLFAKANSPYLKFGQETLFEAGKKSTNEIIECGDTSIPFSIPSHQFSRFIIAFDFGIGYEFLLNEKLKCYLEPNIEFSANSFLKNDILPPIGFNELDRHFLNIGINTGFRF